MEMFLTRCDLNITYQQVYPCRLLNNFLRNLVLIYCLLDPVYSNKPDRFEALKDNVRLEIGKIDLNVSKTLHCVDHLLISNSFK